MLMWQWLRLKSSSLIVSISHVSESVIREGYRKETKNIKKKYCPVLFGFVIKERCVPTLAQS